jgi:hypothetical protein
MKLLSILLAITVVGCCAPRCDFQTSSFADIDIQTVDPWCDDTTMESFSSRIRRAYTNDW